MSKHLYLFAICFLLVGCNSIYGYRPDSGDYAERRKVKQQCEKEGKKIYGSYPSGWKCLTEEQYECEMEGGDVRHYMTGWHCEKPKEYKEYDVNEDSMSDTRMYNLRR